MYIAVKGDRISKYIFFQVPMDKTSHPNVIWKGMLVSTGGQNWLSAMPGTATHVKGLSVKRLNKSAMYKT